MTKEELNNYIEEVFATAEKPRKMVAYTGCKTYGMINIMETNCNDPECKPCSAFVNAIKEESKNWENE